MDVKPAEALGECGRLFRMPETVAGGSDELKSAWVLGVFSGIVGEDEFEIKDIAVEETEKTYSKLEIHSSSPQMYAVMHGSVAVPAALNLDGGAVEFYRVARGEAIVVRSGVWHGGAVGLDVPARVMVVLRKGTSECDTKKEPVSPVVEFGTCSVGTKRPLGREGS